MASDFLVIFGKQEAPGILMPAPAATTKTLSETQIGFIQIKMKKHKILLLYLFFFSSLQAQNPLIKQWDYRFGGLDHDYSAKFVQTNDGGYIIGGSSLSGIGGDKTQPTLNSLDYWICKIDSSGIKQWDKNFGGTIYDVLISVAQTLDGGYILGGWSNSGIGGNKTQPCWGSYDYWVIKVDSLGVKQWDKTFGGNMVDEFTSLQQTSDGGYIFGGYSISGISGDKTQATNGYNDYWIVKTDSLGNKQWDKTYGGTESDYLRSLMQTLDEGYILGGYSYSDVGGDKTQNTQGLRDYWIIKIDSVGNKQWDKDFGGTTENALYDLQQTQDGGFILGGGSNSGIGGDKTQNTWGGWDFWIIKTDSFGNKLWDKDFGGNDVENQFGEIIQTIDNGYLFAGTSRSGISGNKTENNLGIAQTWTVKIDSVGNIQWDKTLLVNGKTLFGHALECSDECYTMLNYNNALIGGDKTQDSWNSSYDYWIIKYCDTTLTGTQNIFNSKGQLNIFPNPFVNNVSIEIQKQNIKQITLNIKNVIGQTVFNKIESGSFNNYGLLINLHSLSTGIYFLDCSFDGERIVKKIMKE